MSLNLPETSAQSSQPGPASKAPTVDRSASEPNGTTGLGDFQFFDLVAINQSWGRRGLGPALVFPTATSDLLGQGKWQAGVELNWILTGHSKTH